MLENVLSMLNGNERVVQVKRDNDSKILFVRWS